MSEIGQSRDGAGLLGSLNEWVASNPWHPRVLPMFVYLIGLLGASLFWDVHPLAYIGAYVVMCLATAWVAWRYRKLMPELNFRFHWLAIPIGLFVAATWMGMAFGMIELFPAMFDQPGDDFFEEMGPGYAWLALSLRLLGMSIVVPIAEELLFRSLLLRAFHRPKRVWIGLLNFLADVPGIGEIIMKSSRGRRAAKITGIFTHEFYINALGVISVSGVVISTAIFMLNHALRDWPAIWICGISYCLLVYWTGRRHGLGPVIWAHGLTNACLWAYTIWMHLSGSGDWRFL